MAKLNVYQDDKLVGSGEDKVHVDLPGAEYPAGTFTGELVDPDGFITPRFEFPAVTVALPIISGFTIEQNGVNNDGKSYLS